VALRPSRRSTLRQREGAQSNRGSLPCSAALTREALGRHGRRNVYVYLSTAASILTRITKVGRFTVVAGGGDK